MIYHGFCPASFICANIIPIPKGSKVNLSDSDKYRSIAISSILRKILDHIIIGKQSDALTGLAKIRTFFKKVMIFFIFFI